MYTFESHNFPIQYGELALTSCAQSFYSPISVLSNDTAFAHTKLMQVHERCAHEVSASSRYLVAVPVKKAHNIRLFTVIKPNAHHRIKLSRIHCHASNIMLRSFEEKIHSAEHAALKIR